MDAQEMLEELAKLCVDDGRITFEVDDIARNEDGDIVTIYGTKTVWDSVTVNGSTAWTERHTAPYILGDV